MNLLHVQVQVCQAALKVLQGLSTQAAEFLLRAFVLNFSVDATSIFLGAK